MSKLSKQIRELGSTANVPLEPLNYTDVTMTTEKFNPDYGRRIAIGCRFGTTVCISELEIVENPFAIEFAVDKIKEAVIEEIFGEFRLPLMEIRLAALNRNYSKIQTIVDQIESDMFR